MDSILMSALAGAAGGAAGAGIAWLVGRVRGRQPKWLAILPVIGIGIALAAARSLQPSLGERVMTGIDELPSVEALKTYYPEDYDTLRSKVIAYTGAGGPDGMRIITAGVFSEVLRRQSPKADAQSVYGLRLVTRGYAGALRDVDARGCFDMMEGKAAPPSLAKVSTSALEAQDMEATTRLLVQTATKPAAPAAPMSFDELLGLSSAALATLPDKDQDVAITVLREERDPRTPEEDRIMCAFNLAFADQLLALTPAVGGEKMRAMHAME